MNEKRYIRTSQKLVTGLSGFIILIIGFLWASNSRGREWIKYQADYVSLLNRINDSLELNDANLPAKGVYEIDLYQFNRIDRCISCHTGLEDPLMANAPQPHKLHPGNYLEYHPIADYGCTMCHGGQGRAMNKKDAFGLERNTHWPEPILFQPYIQASCGKCHLAVFDGNLKLEGTEVFRHGQDIFSSEGCLGCHKARGVGGLIGPDLTRQGEKTRHEYNFQNVEGEQTVSNWLKEHFRDPEMVSPGSQMLKIDLPEGELEALATFVMGLSKPDIPFDYFSIEMLEELKGIRHYLGGDKAYSFTCSACHGKMGDGKDYEKYKTGVPAIMNPDFVRVASESFVYFTLLKGRSRKQMAAWEAKASGLKEKEIVDISSFVQSSKNSSWKLPLQNTRNGDALLGEKIYSAYCLTCHGEDGKGGLAVSLNQAGFLNRASDKLILETLAHGRENTAMPAWTVFAEKEMRDLLTYIRTWHSGPINPVPFTLPVGIVKEGEVLYHYNCSRCHGVNGEGNTGPAVINRSFFSAASDHYIYKTVAEGRAHTSMFGWSVDLNNQESLDIREISHIITFMKNKAVATPAYIYAGRNPGNNARGKQLFNSYCAECHGNNGEGVSAPGLNSQEFLSAASNGYMLATVTIGREGTRMPAWGYINSDYDLLSATQRQDIVAFIRSWQRIHIGF